MRELSPGLISSLSESVTTLCSAWKLELKDGRVFGFSEHDRELVIDGVVYSAGSSLTESEAEHRLGFASDNGAVEGVLDAASISEMDISNGVLNDAKLSRLKVNWQDPTQFVVTSVGELGQVTTRRDHYEIEWLGLSHKLSRSTGRVFSRKCDASFGDTRCGVDTSQFSEVTICPKTLEACRHQFDNLINFRGFPFLLGDDGLYSGPKVGAPKDGGSRYK